jgi:ribosomal protein S27E
MKPHLPQPEAIFPSRSPLIAAGEPPFPKMEDPMNRAKPFEAPRYALRHGSPDKVPYSAFAELGEFFEVSCPDCGAVLCVDSSLLSLSPELECAGCGGAIALTPDGRIRRALRVVGKP